ncbi:MAG TPA: oxidoreductase [Propionibacteriaceae bacterium]|nr:oxidoreductase [Propionibacteriaceae bacterium]
MSLPDLTGRRVVITGGNAGLGFVSARTLASAGAHVLLAVRDLKKGEAAAAQIRAAADGASVNVAALDLADLASVRAFADAQLESGPLDILINNAGLMLVPTRQLTADGHEMHMGVNHLGHFALTLRLMPVLSESPAARVVSVSSVAHRLTGSLDRRLGLEGRYTSMTAYSQSKLACALFGFELHRRLRQAHVPITSVVAHPGVVATELFTRQLRPGIFHRVTGALTPLLGSAPEHGAQPQIRAAADPSLVGGELIGPRFLLRGEPVLEVPARNARDFASAAWLWERSEQFTGLSLKVLTG